MSGVMPGELFANVNASLTAALEQNASRHSQRLPLAIPVNPIPTLFFFLLSATAGANVSWGGLHGIIVHLVPWAPRFSQDQSRDHLYGSPESAVPAHLDIPRLFLIEFSS
jgi:hypothetical protein